MIGNEPLAQLPVGAAYRAAPAVALDADFNARWAAWVARGSVYEQRTRRKFAVLAGVLSIGAAMVDAFLGS